MKTKKIIFGCFMCLFVFVTAFLTSNFIYGETPQIAEELSSSAKAMCVLEQTTGRVLYGKNIHEKLPMASLTKIFTALTILENCDDLDKKVKVDDRAIGIEGTSIYLRKGENLSIKELLYGTILPSGNDSATALAYAVCDNMKDFCKLMEKTAKNAGCLNSSFKNAHGLDANGHYTTAYDLAKISAKALQNETFREISMAKSTTISGNSEVKTRYLKNKNRLLGTFEGCTGIKTGFTDNAGRCFVSSATRNDLSIVCAVLNCQPMFEECASLMEKAFSNYKMTELLPSYKIVDTIPVEKGRENLVKVFTRSNFSYPLTNHEILRINYITDIPEKLIAPIEKEKVIGTLKIYLDDKLIFEDEILTQDFVKKESIFSYIKDISKLWK